MYPPSHRIKTRKACALAAAAALLLLGVRVSAQVTSPPKAIDFGRDIQPILKAHCFQCHAGDQKQGGLTLDTRSTALKGGASGSGISPGDPGKSLLMARVLGVGGKPRMPLGFAPLSDAQTALLKTWIEQGAGWPDSAGKTHWAYVKPVRPIVPKVKTAGWVRNPIDNFILAKLEHEKVKPNPEADRVTLLRRITLDLTGLPPTPQEIDAFMADRSPSAYEKVVDRLFASPHYGEKMALPWLDTARYADSNGFQQDGDTFQYVWRDWVVKALNANMPFDQFTIQQLAGDLLPNATEDQKVATGFNRCNLLNGEGGAIPEEQRNVILFDRVDVTATTFLGATLACAQCHDHKYDPLTRKDYYSFMAFFNNVPESGTPSGSGQYRIADPFLVVSTDEDKARIAAAEGRLNTAKTEQAKLEASDEVKAAQAKWESDAAKQSSSALAADTWQMTGPLTADSFDSAYDKKFGPEVNLKPGSAYSLSPGDKWSSHPEYADGKVYILNGENSAFYLFRHIHADSAGPLRLSFGSDDAIKVWLNGEQIVADKAQRAAAPDQELVTAKLRAGDNDLLVKIVNGGGIGGFYFKMLDSGTPSDVLAIIKRAGARSDADSAKVSAYFLASFAPPEVKKAHAASEMITKEIADLKANLPRVMIMSDAKPRVTHLLLRGNYEMPGEVVEPGTPASLPPMPGPKNRLGLAQWLISPDNPLTARVQVNRYWQLFFGAGLVKTSENLGTQCDPPSNPALLDWLAVEFRESGWNVKRMQRLLVTSATYRQSSRLSPEMRAKDPENRLVARAARFRMPSLLLRDIALDVSGLLNPQIGGKPVYPYQPRGIWDGLAITNERDFTYPQSKGADLYRRSLYTFWRRTVAPSNMFDASVRQTCKVRLATTSTPLHSLTMLNDETWVEAGRALAQIVLKEPGNDPSFRLTEAFRRVCARRPTPGELNILRRDLDRGLAAYKADPAAAAEYVKIGESPRDMSIDPVVHAAYAGVCLAILNLDEAMTRE